MDAILHSWFLMIRNLSYMVRSPFIIGMNIIQPVLWMLLFSAVFQNIVEIPGFTASSYIDFLSPGIVVMSTLMAGSYAGLGLLVDYNQGVLNRFLVTPVHRVSIIIGSLLQHAVTLTVQGFIMIGLAMLLGAEFNGGGIIVLIFCAVILGIAFGALSMALAITIRQEEALTSAVAFSTMPLLFLSELFMPLDLVPNWMAALAGFNPVNWAIAAGREALMTSGGWSDVWLSICYLLSFAFISIGLAILVFHRYQKNL